MGLINASAGGLRAALPIKLSRIHFSVLFTESREYCFCLQFMVCYRIVGCGAIVDLKSI